MSGSGRGLGGERGLAVGIKRERPGQGDVQAGDIPAGAGPGGSALALAVKSARAATRSAENLISGWILALMAPNWTGAGASSKKPNFACPGSSVGRAAD